MITPEKRLELTRQVIQNPSDGMTAISVSDLNDLLTSLHAVQMNGRNLARTLAEVERVTDKVAALWADHEGTHHRTCINQHVQCLAFEVQAIVKGRD